MYINVCTHHIGIYHILQLFDMFNTSKFLKVLGNTLKCGLVRDKRYDSRLGFLVWG